MCIAGPSKRYFERRADLEVQSLHLFLDFCAHLLKGSRSGVTNHNEFSSPYFQSRVSLENRLLHHAGWIGGHSHRRRRLQIPGARPPVSKAEKTLLFLLVLLIVAVLVRISMQERPPGVEIVSPKEATFTPPR